MEIVLKNKIISPVDGEYLLQLEDWHEDYPNTFAPCSTLAAYPAAKAPLGRGFVARKKGETFRLQMDFESAQEAAAAMSELFLHSKTLKDFAPHFYLSPTVSQDDILSVL